MKSEVLKPTDPGGLVPRGRLSGDPDPTNRVIRVDSAIKCCQLAVDQALALAEQAVIFLKEGGLGDGNEALALVWAPGVVELEVGAVTAPRWIRIAKGARGIAGVGAAIAIGAELLAEIESKIGAAAFLEAVSGINTAIAQATRQKGGPCTKCMMARALPQRPNKRRRRVVSSRR